mmetsp:Transcript_15846/g.22300  ORF Transcript_15846/g.22300 Transcript_15846/m.22300 type:complete len:207 (-) Transcript_15846:1133-1753(-)
MLPTMAPGRLRTTTTNVVATSLKRGTTTARRETETWAFSWRTRNLRGTLPSTLVRTPTATAVAWSALKSATTFLTGSPAHGSMSLTSPTPSKTARVGQDLSASKLNPKTLLTSTCVSLKIRTTKLLATPLGKLPTIKLNVKQPKVHGQLTPTRLRVSTAGLQNGAELTTSETAATANLSRTTGLSPLLTQRALASSLISRTTWRSV